MLTEPYGYFIVPLEDAKDHQDLDWHDTDHAGYFNIARPKFRTLEEAQAARDAAEEAHIILKIHCATRIHRTLITRLAELYETTVEQFGIHTYHLMQLIQAHQGAHHRTLEMYAKANNLPFNYLEDDQYASLIKKMAFRADKGNEWYVRRQPQAGDVWEWQREYCRIFGDTSHQARTWVDCILAAEATYHESMRPKVTRPHNRNSYEDLPTLTIAHRAAVVYCLAAQAMTQYIANTKAEIYRYLWNVYSEEHRILQSELQYRTEAQPKERKSKRATEKAKADFRLANDHLAARGDTIFTPAFRTALAKADYPLPLHLDEIIPRDLSENTPPSLQETRDILQTVIKLTELDLDPTSFEAEDIALLLKTLRKTLESIKANHILKQEAK